MKEQDIKLGDVFSIPLPNGKFAFCRIFRGAAMAFYQDVVDFPDQLPTVEVYQFTVGVNINHILSDQWQRVDYRPFATEDEAWPPPSYVVDVFTEKYKIYHKGVISKERYTKEECAGMEKTIIWRPEDIVKRLMGEDSLSAQSARFNLFGKTEKK